MRFKSGDLAKFKNETGWLSQVGNMWSIHIENAQGYSHTIDLLPEEIDMLEAVTVEEKTPIPKYELIQTVELLRSCYEIIKLCPIPRKQIMEKIVADCWAQVDQYAKQSKG